jgi:hypothetical protein
MVSSVFRKELKVILKYKDNRAQILDMSMSKSRPKIVANTGINRLSKKECIVRKNKDQFI